MLERENVLIFAFNCHLQSHDPVFDVIALRLNRVNNVALRPLYFVLQTHDPLLQLVALLGRFLSSLVRLEELWLHLC